MGDFNFPELNWSVEAENISESHPIVECMNNNFLIQVVLEPTHGINFLDLILCLEEDMITDLYVGEPFETSDHQLIRFKLNRNKHRTKETMAKFNFLRRITGI